MPDYKERIVRAAFKWWIVEVAYADLYTVVVRASCIHAGSKVNHARLSCVAENRQWKSYTNWEMQVPARVRDWGDKVACFLTQQYLKHCIA